MNVVLRKKHSTKRQGRIETWTIPTAICYVCCMNYHQKKVLLVIFIVFSSNFHFCHMICIVYSAVVAGVCDASRVFHMFSVMFAKNCYQNNVEVCEYYIKEKHQITKNIMSKKCSQKLIIQHTNSGQYDICDICENHVAYR